MSQYPAFASSMLGWVDGFECDFLAAGTRGLDIGACERREHTVKHPHQICRIVCGKFSGPFKRVDGIENGGGFVRDRFDVVEPPESSGALVFDRLSIKIDHEIGFHAWEEMNSLWHG